MRSNFQCLFIVAATWLGVSNAVLTLDRPAGTNYWGYTTHPLDKTHFVVGGNMNFYIANVDNGVSMITTESTPFHTLGGEVATCGNVIIIVTRNNLKSYLWDGATVSSIVSDITPPAMKYNDTYG
jgi:hypothetical protein